MIETGLISFATWLGTKIADKGFDSIYSKLESKSSFDDIFIDCIQDTAKNFEKKYPDVLGNSISYFFTQDDVFDELCKLLFVNQQINIDIISETFHEASLPTNFMLDFISELKATLTLVPEFQLLLSNKELFITVKGISKGVKELSQNSSLTLEEIKSIKKILEDRFKSKFSLDSFLVLYRKNLVNNLGTLNFIGLGIDPTIKKGKRKAVEEIFVKPLFELKSLYHIEHEKKNKINYPSEIDEYGRDVLISYESLFDRPYNYVILGNPGAGKSLLVKSIVCNIANKVANQFSNKSVLSSIPFRIELKNYLAYKKENGGNILKYLTYSLEEEYSVPSILEENLLSVFKSEKIIIFFDGLDEIFNASDKNNVKNDIENIHNLFPKIKSITTSRFIGYNEVKLNEKDFCELNINSFGNSQIEEYVNKWYSLEEEDKNIRNTETSDFISKMSNIDNELISNPLLLSLIVILYRNNLKIPESKLEIYQSCTHTLVDKWDASKNLDIKLSYSILHKKEPILADLAFWQYETLSSKNLNITYHQAKNTVANSLIKKKVADEFDADSLAEDFLSYAQKRSIYFDNNFTHKTFLEYYSAYWIYSNIEKKHLVKERNRIIKKYTSNPFWYIVLELLLNMIDKNQPDTEIIDTIFSEQIKYPKSLPFLIYVLPNLNNISNAVIVEAYITAIKYLILGSRIDPKRKDVYKRIIINLFTRNQTSFFKEALLTIPDHERNQNYYILILELRFSPRYSSSELDTNDIINSDRYKSFAKQDPYLFKIGSFSKNDEAGYVEVGSFINQSIEFIKLFGPREYFKENQAKFADFELNTYIGNYFYNQLQEKNIESIEQNLKLLNENSISFSDLIKYVIGDNLYFKSDITTLNYLCNKIVDENTTDSQKLIFVIILKQHFSNRYFHFGELGIAIEELSASPILKSLLNSTVAFGISKFIGKALVSLEIQDVDILNLESKIKDWVENN